MELYSEISSYSKLIQGFYRVQQNDGAPGFDHVSIEDFEANLEKNIARLNQELKNLSYNPQPLLIIDRIKADGKIRHLSIASVRDRVVQSSAFLVIEPFMDQQFEKESYGFRKGFSRQGAARKINDLFNHGYQWILDADIFHFFDTVDHDILLDRLKLVINETKTLELIKKWIQGEYVYKLERKKFTVGLPQGLVVSPMLANLYLDKFDETISANGFKLVRYADDFVILTKTKPEAEKAYQLTKELLADLKLQLNPDKTHVTSFQQGFKYLGFLFVNSLIVPISKKDTSPQFNNHSAEENFNSSITTNNKVTDEIRKLSKKRRPSKKEFSATTSSQSVSSTPISEDNLSRTVMGESLLNAIEQKGITLNDFIKNLQIGSSPATPFQEDIQTFAGEDCGFYEDDGVNNLDISKEILIPPVKQSNISFKHSLYIQEQGSILKKEGNRFIVEKEGKEVTEIPFIKVNQIIIFGNCTITPAVWQACLMLNLPIVLLSSHGKYFGRIESTQSSNAELEQMQLLRSLEDKFKLSFAKQSISAKVSNLKVFLQRNIRRRANTDVEKTVAGLTETQRYLSNSSSLDEVRGYEGRAAVIYFSTFGQLFDIGTSFYSTNFQRVKRPPTDPVNSLLSFGYTLLSSNVHSFLRTRGLNPFLGFFHALRNGHPALASDLLEEFRHVIDSLVVQILNKKIFTNKDFYFAKEPGAPCFLTNEARKEFIRQFEIKMNQRTTHTETNLKADYRRCLDLQVQQLVKVVKGEKDIYQPFKITF